MAVEQSEREFFVSLQKELAELDPTIMEFDLDDPDTRLAIMLTAALLKGNSVELVGEREDGEQESMTMESLGSSPDGQQSIVLTVRSTDGTLAPETAGFVAVLLDESHQTEISQLTGE